MSKFKAGDLALIVRASIDENLGKVVELVGWSDESEIVLSDGGRVNNPSRLRCWEVSADQLIATSMLFPDGFTTKRGAVPEKNLMPLRGDFHTEREKSREVPA